MNKIDIHYLNKIYDDVISDRSKLLENIRKSELETDRDDENLLSSYDALLKITIKLKNHKLFNEKKAKKST